MSSTKLYCSWFCPFAQRVWIAVNYKGITYEYVEQDPYEKSPEWLAISPRGLIPCVVNEGKSIYESTVCLEYIDEFWTDGPSLLPKDPYARAVARIWSDHVSKKVVPPFYALLLKRTNEERESAKEDILSGVRSFQDAISESGPYFMGKDFGLVDCMMGPFVQRMSKGSVTDVYRGFYIPETPEFAKFQKWWQNVQEVDAFKSTVQPVERILFNYKRYEDDSAETEVATAIRQGTALP